MVITRLPRGSTAESGRYPKALTFKGLNSGTASSNPRQKQPKRSAAWRKALARYYERRRLRKQRQNIEITAIYRSN